MPTAWVPTAWAVKHPRMASGLFLRPARGFGFCFGLGTAAVLPPPKPNCGAIPNMGFNRSASSSCTACLLSALASKDSSLVVLLGSVRNASICSDVCQLCVCVRV